MSELKPKGWIDEGGCLHTTLDSAEFTGKSVTPLYALPEGYVLVPVEPNYKSKFECLVEHCKRQDQELARLRYDENVRRFYDEGSVWFWAGDETDNLETLACPVVINAGDLRTMLAAAQEIQP